MDQEEEPSLFDFSDDLVVDNSKKKAEKKELTLEEWICRKPTAFLYNCLSSRRTGPEHIKKYLSYDWSNPSDAAKKALDAQLDAENKFHPLEGIAKHKDPTGGALLKLCLDNSKISVKDFVGKQSPHSLLRLAAPFGFLYETEVFLKHGANPLENNGETLECVVRESRIEIIKLFKQYVTDVDLFFKSVIRAAAMHSFTVLKYLIEEEKVSIEGRFPDKTVLQMLIHNERYSHVNINEAISYILPLVSNIDETDSIGNTAMLIAFLDNQKLVDVEKLYSTYTILIELLVLYYVIYYRRYDDWLLNLILQRGPSIEKNKNILFNAIDVEVDDKSWKILADWCSRDVFKMKNSEGENLLHFACKSSISYEFVLMLLDSLKEKDLLADMMLEKNNNGDLPIFTALLEFDRIEAETLKSEVAHLQSVMRIKVRKLISLAKELGIDFTKFHSGQNVPFDALLAKNNLLPKERRVSHRIFSEQVDLDLGDMTILPRDVLVHIFQWLDLSDAVKALTVSKKFFQVLTSKQVWAKELPSSTFSAIETIEPFSKLCAIERTKKCMALPSNPWYSEVIDVIKGEGNLSFEHELIYGLKLHGKPIIATFPDNGGSIVRCILRCGSLTEEKRQYVARLEHILNNGVEALDVSTFMEDMTPFMNVLDNGTYRASLLQHQEFMVFEYDSQSLPSFFSEYPSKQLLLFTQPSDQLDRFRIEHYKEEIERGKRPIILLLYGCWEYYLIDGHHKMKAYMETNTTDKAIYISIDIVRTEKYLSRAEELQYIMCGNHEAMKAHQRSMRYHKYPEDPRKRENIKQGWQ